MPYYTKKDMHGLKAGALLQYNETTRSYYCDADNYTPAFHFPAEIVSTPGNGFFEYRTHEAWRAMQYPLPKSEAELFVIANKRFPWQGDMHFKRHDAQLHAFVEGWKAACIANTNSEIRHNKRAHRGGTKMAKNFYIQK